MSRIICYDIVAKGVIDDLLKRAGGCSAGRLLSLAVRSTRYRIVVLVNIVGLVIRSITVSYSGK